MPSRRSDGAALEKWFNEFALSKSPRIAQQVRIFCEAAADDVPTFPGLLLKTGYLTKLGGNKQGGAGNWKRRFVVLSDTLAYYENEDSYLSGADPKGSVDLNAIYCPTPPSNALNEFVIHALPYDFYARAEAIDDMLHWVKLLRRELPYLEATYN